METKELVIPQEIAQAILNYLQTKPYVEVHLLIEALMALKEKEEQ